VSASKAGSNTEATHGTRIRSSYLARLLTYLIVMGPGLIVRTMTRALWPPTPRRVGNMACTCYGCS
jgi:hypothetical protein